MEKVICAFMVLISVTGCVDEPVEQPKPAVKLDMAKPPAPWPTAQSGGVQLRGCMVDGLWTSCRDTQEGLEVENLTSEVRLVKMMVSGYNHGYDRGTVYTIIRLEPRQKTMLPVINHHFRYLDISEEHGGEIGHLRLICR